MSDVNNLAYCYLTTNFPAIAMHLELEEGDPNTATIYVTSGDLMTPYTATDASMDTAIELACLQVWAVLAPTHPTTPP